VASAAPTPAPAPAPAPAPTSDDGGTPTPAPTPTPTYDPRTPERAAESGVPWYGVPPGVTVKAGVGGALPTVVKAPPGYVPPEGYVISPGLKQEWADTAKISKKVAQAPPPTEGEQAEWSRLAREGGVDPLAYSQLAWLQERGLTTEDLVRSGTILPGVTRQVGERVALAPSAAVRKIFTPKAQQRLGEV